MKNEEAWEYVRQVAFYAGAGDSEDIAQNIMMKRWERDLPRGYWAIAARNAVASEWRARRRHQRLTPPESGIHQDDHDSRLVLQELAAREPEALRVVLSYVLSDHRTNAERVAVCRARKLLRRTLVL